MPFVFNRVANHFKVDTLFRNSIYLMASTGVMAVFGFVFWILVAHFYHPAQVGIAATLISSMNFIAQLCLLGFNSTFIRYLPKSRNRNSQIDTGLILVATAAIIVASLYVIGAPHFAPKLSLLHQNVLYGIGFVLLALGASINLVTDSIYIAYRSSGYNLLIDGIIASSIQLSLPILLIGLGSYGIYAAQGSAAFVAMILSIVLLVIRFNYRPSFKIDRATIKEIMHYSSGNYAANLLNILPTVILPIIVLNKLGAAAAGYYYLAFMMATLLFTVAYAVSQSSFAEGSHGDIELWPLMKRSAIILGSIMIPASILLAVIGPLVLDVFGRAYGANAGQVLVIFAAAGPFVATYILGSVILRITKQVKTLVLVNVIYGITISGLAWIWATRGLPWVSGAWLVGHAITTLFIFVVLVWRRRSHFVIAHTSA